MRFVRRCVSLLVMFSLLMVMGYSYAAEKVVVKKDGASLSQGASETVNIDGVALTVDQDYSWDAVMQRSGIKVFDPKNADHQKARAICLAADKAWSKYREYREASDFANSEKYALNSLVRGWCAWNAACAEIGNWQDGHWVYDDGATEEAVENALKDLERATNYASLSGDKKTGKNNVVQLLDRIASTNEYIKQRSSVQAIK